MNNNCGTYSHCSKCKNHTCCTDFNDSIDNIMVSKDEKEKIINKYNAPESYFLKITEDVFHLISLNGVCPFYCNGCKIYEDRPNDCRLFPFDILKKDDKYFLIKYDLLCGSSSVTEYPEDVIENLMLIKDVYTASENAEKVSELPYKIIKEILPL